MVRIRSYSIQTFAPKSHIATVGTVTIDMYWPSVKIFKLVFRLFLATVRPSVQIRRMSLYLLATTSKVRVVDRRYSLQRRSFSLQLLSSTLAIDRISSREFSLEMLQVAPILEENFIKSWIPTSSKEMVGMLHVGCWHSVFCLDGKNIHQLLNERHQPQLQR